MYFSLTTSSTSRFSFYTLSHSSSRTTTSSSSPTPFLQPPDPVPSPFAARYIPYRPLRRGGSGLQLKQELSECRSASDNHTGNSPTQVATEPSTAHAPTTRRAWPYSHLRNPRESVRPLKSNKLDTRRSSPLGPGCGLKSSISYGSRIRTWGYLSSSLGLPRRNEPPSGYGDGPGSSWSGGHFSSIRPIVINAGSPPIQDRSHYSTDFLLQKLEHPALHPPSADHGMGQRAVQSS